MKGISPIVRISLSLALLTLSLLLTGDLFFGERTDEDQIKMEARRRICESLAIQFSSLIAVGDMSTIRLTLKNLVLRDDDVLSPALRTIDGRIRAGAGNHNVQWQDMPFDKSTVTHTQVPIFRNNTRWGTVEIRFADAEVLSTWQRISTPFSLLAVYMFLAGFVGYVFFMRRTLKHLDPGAVIPERVKAALDILTEGVILVDTKQQVVLANSAISDKLGLSSSDLLGKNLARLGWVGSKSEDTTPKEFPWQSAMAKGGSQIGARLELALSDSEHTFMVNSSPILDDKGKAQGALTTFDDITEWEEKNLQLKGMVNQLQSSRDEVSRKNDELQVLAERDSLTNCLNRRAFFERADAEFEIARDGDAEMSIIMLDIDHFKSVNDEYGHGVGDEVIKSIANILQTSMRGDEVVGRYGGEEFCVLVPNASIEIGAKIGERLRKQIEENATKTIPKLAGNITASFGVSSAAGGADDTGKLVDQADQALYASKEYGRNRVSRWDEI